MHSNRIIGGTIAALTVGCLFLTGWIMHRSGALQGATEDGRWALGLAAIAVHLGLAVFGLAMFASRKAVVTLVCGLMVLGAAACSAWQIATFLATEVISVTKAREATEKRADARHQAELDAAADKRKTAAELAKQQLTWFQGTGKSRRERKDMAEGGNKLIADIGKADAPAAKDAPAPTAEPALQSGAVAQWVAARMGWDETAMQASPYLMIALMLLAIEVVGWPMASFFWHRPTQAAVRYAPAYAPPPPMPEPAPPSAQIAAPVAAQLPAPEPVKVHPSKMPAPERIERRALPHSVATLIEIGFPLTKPAGALRIKDPPKDAARRFVVWAKAMDLAGQYTPEDLYRLYLEFASADHREPAAFNYLLGALDRTRGIDKTRPQTADGKRPTFWVITPGKYPKPAAKEGGRVVVPFSKAPDDPAPTETAPMRTLNFRDDDQPAIAQARARAWRRDGRRSRRQRGPRINRRAA
jgi:hypothetical protein